MSHDQFSTIHSATGTPLKSYDYMKDEEIYSKVERSFEAHKKWKKLSVEKRNVVLSKLKSELELHKQRIAHQIHLEMGKTQKEAIAEVEKSLTLFDYYFANASSLLKEKAIPSLYKRTVQIHEPLGVILGIMPWNFPVWQVLRFAIPCLISGNSVLLKHSDITAGTAELLEEIFHSALGDLYFNLRMTHDQSSKVIADFKIRGVSFTGSSRGGREVASVAGENLKKCVLELGGSDPYVLLPDGDVDDFANKMFKLRSLNHGQSCVSAKRIFIPENLKDPFLKQYCFLWEQIENRPLAHSRFVVTAWHQVELLNKAGGVKVWEQRGQFQKDEAMPSSALFPAQIWLFNEQPEILKKEEFFSPVSVVITYKDTEKLIHDINSTCYGLGGGVFSSDEIKAEEFARQIESGMISVNDMIKSEAALPFGGFKDSGFGRESGEAGLLEFTQIKTISFS